MDPSVGPILIALVTGGGLWKGADVILKWRNDTRPSRSSLEAVEVSGKALEIQQDVLDSVYRELKDCQADCDRQDLEIERQEGLIHALELDKVTCHSNLAMVKADLQTQQSLAQKDRERIQSLESEFAKVLDELKLAKDAAQRGGRRKDDSL